jgi:hypothetical protein
MKNNSVYFFNEELAKLQLNTCRLKIGRSFIKQSPKPLKRSAYSSFPFLGELSINTG